MVNVMWYGHQKNLSSSTGCDWLLDVTGIYYETAGKA